MMGDLQRRLRKLECNRPPPQESEDDRKASALAFFITYAIGFYLGNPIEAEAPIAAYARALGYEHQGEIIKSAGPAEWVDEAELTERDAQARTKLFLKFGLKLDEDNLPEWQPLIEALKRMYAGMSEKYKNLANEYLRFD